MSKNADNEKTALLLQQWFNRNRNAGLTEDGWAGNATRKAIARLLAGFLPQTATLAPPQPQPLPTTQPAHGRPRVALCVGHSRRGDSGAASVGNVSEWVYNSDIAKLTAARLEAAGIEARIIDSYPADSYGAAMTWLAGQLRAYKPAAMLELHFNAATPSAHGFEHLYHPDSPASKVLARDIARHQAAAFPDDTARRNGGTYARADGSGTGFLRLHTIAPAVLPEPFFGSNHAQWATYGSPAGMQRLAGVYADSLISFLGVTR
jgi:N-acetylmuramoyl-L-alanine amidase